MAIQQAPPEALIDAATAAEEVGNLEAAALMWEDMRRHYPDHYRGFVSGGVVLKEMGKLSDAAELFEVGTARFPDNEWLAKEHAWTVQELGDVSTAVSRWRNIREAFPDNVDGYIGGGLAHRQAGEFDEADAVYRAGLERLSDQQTLYVDLAWSAEERKDMPEAIVRWGEVRTRFPDVVEGHVRTGMALIEAGQLADAEPVLAEAVRLFPDHEEAATEYAWIAHNQNDWLTALRRWETVISRFPQSVPARRFAAEALVELGRSIEASGVLAPALRMHPDDPDICVMSGWLATQNKDYKLAEQIWRDVRERFPERVEGYHGYAQVLREEGKWPEAEAMLSLAIERFPDDPVLAMDFAQIPDRRHNWAESIARWRPVIDRFPDLPGGYLGLGTSLLGEKKYVEAAQVFREGMGRLPDNVELAAAEADAAAKAMDWPKALGLWSIVQTWNPDNPVGYWGYGKTLRESGQLSISRRFLTAATKRFPDIVDLEVELAFTISAQREWPTALAMWESLKRRFPENNDIRSNITFVVGQAVADQHAHGAAAFEIPALLLEHDDLGDGQAAATAATLKHFESLGDSCEFGMVQRMYQVEQMSLLRWARTSPTDIVTALNTQFAGVGDPEFTIIDVAADEYTTQDTRYHMHSHTFTSPRAEPIELFRPEQCRRMQWLRRKLIDNLTAASKVFIYKSEIGISDAEIDSLYAALQRYNPKVQLLCVRLEVPGHPNASVSEIREGLFLGYIDKFSTVDISVSTWLTLCESVWDGISARTQPAEVAAR